MSHLLYCVFRSDDDRSLNGSLGSRSGCRSEARFPSLSGVGRSPVRYLSEAGLCAAVSRVEGGAVPQDIREVLAYENVMESLHRDRGLIPFRYGARFQTERGILGHLEENKIRYQALLKDLNDCVEMGVSLLFDFAASDPQHANEKKVDAPTPRSPGLAYLAARRQAFTQDDSFLRRQERISEKICRSLAGLYLRSRKETPKESNQLGQLGLSLHFLLHRNSMGAFREAFRRIQKEKNIKLLLSGPWPPYNFVDSPGP